MCCGRLEIQRLNFTMCFSKARGTNIQIVDVFLEAGDAKSQFYYNMFLKAGETKSSFDDMFSIDRKTEAQFYNDFLRKTKQSAGWPCIPLETTQCLGRVDRNARCWPKHKPF